VIVPLPVSETVNSGVPLRSAVAYAVMVPVIVNGVVKFLKVPSAPAGTCGATNVLAAIWSDPVIHAWNCCP
jgi:hypothetical protein